MQYFDTGIMQPLLVGDLFVEDLSCLCMLFAVDVVAVAGAAHGKAFGPASPGWKLEPRSLGAVAWHRDRGQMGGASALVTSLIQMVAKFVSLHVSKKFSARIVSLSRCFCRAGIGSCILKGRL